ncbi:MAG: recombinase family protein [Dysosmobacter sp.]|nr:recombinase family protein [Dysosmobacter sp.]
MASQKYTILYGRLSQEDTRMGDSNSIINQRLLLEKYAADNGFENAIFLVDDGYSGTNFERPSWKKVIEMIEADEVDTLIVKDMSRLGREYLQVGQLTELYLPTKGVRFIAINDGVDSLVESSTDFNPIRNWANELHAKDTSKKVRAVKKLQAERGERLGGRPPYGYSRKGLGSKEIVPNEETAPVVQRIFDLCASGKGPNQIARILTGEKILTPANYAYQKEGKSHNHVDTTRPYDWSGSSVTGILDNKVYLGHTVGLRSTSLSYKNKKLIRRPESEQITVENTHPALITQEQWDIVQDVRQHKKRVPKQMDEPNIFSGLAFCEDCGKPMVLHRASTMEKARYYYTCYTYGKRGKAACSAHHIREEDLCRIVLDDLQRVTHFARMKERQFAAYINQKNSKELRREMNTLQKELDAMRKRDGELSKLFKRLYEDHVLQRITAEQFRMLSADYNAEQKMLQEAIPEKEDRLEKLKASAANVEAFIEKAKRFTTIDELTPELVRLFIQRIEIGERSVKYSRSSAQSVRIIYRDIGNLDSPMEPGERQPHMATLSSMEECLKLLA